jgi:gliding motility-associated-like protein
MIVQIKRIILLLWIFCFPVQIAFSQQSGRNNYTGPWEKPESWNPTWSAPLSLINGYDITINGYISLNSSLTFSGTSGNLIINDTLLIKGNLTLGNNNNLSIGDNGILIVRGNLIINNETDMTANGYFIITGDIIKLGTNHHGSFISNDNPVKVYIGGTASSLGSSESAYPVVNCPAHLSTQYNYSHCSYGNMTDILNDTILLFFQSTCTSEIPTITAGGPTTFCKGASVTLTSVAGTSYQWSDGATTKSINVNISGSYTVIITNAEGCRSQPSLATVVTVITIPAAPVIKAGGPTTFCSGGSVTLTSGTGESYSWSNGAVTESINVNSAGSYTVQVKNSGGCQSAVSAAVSISVKDKPVPVPGPDQDLKYVFKARMRAELPSDATGEWSLVSGSGQIAENHSPTTMITGLAAGVNIFKWKVSNGWCDASEEVKITVHDLFIPSVITPDGDGKNDLFRISDDAGRVELIIFNRWGNEEYSNDNYLNDWDGKNRKGLDLPADTYFYILKFEDGKISKGSVLIVR